MAVDFITFKYRSACLGKTCKFSTNHRGKSTERVGTVVEYVPANWQVKSEVSLYSGAKTKIFGKTYKRDKFLVAVSNEDGSGFQYFLPNCDYAEILEETC